MGTIPVGNFGQAVAAPTPAIQHNAGEFGAATAKAVGDLGQTLSGIATQQIAQQTRLDQEAADRDAQTAAARVRITKSNQIADAQDLLAQDVMTGKVAKDQAESEWQARSGEILRDATQGIDPRFAGTMQAEFDGLVQRGAMGVRKAVTKRNQDDVQANLLTLGEEYQRAAQRDRGKAQAEYFAQLDVMGPDAGWAPDFIAQKKQQFKEGTAYTEAFGMVRTASRDLKAVRSAREALGSDRFSDLDPQKSAALHAQLDGYETNILQRQEIAAQRAQRESEARLNRARSAFEASQARVLAGIPDNPDQIAVTTQALAGTPYLDTYRAQQQQAREIGGLAAQPVPQQQALLDALNAKIAQGGTSDALIKQRDLVQKAVEASQRDVKEDPIRAGLERGVITAIPPVDVSSIQAFTGTLGKRLEAAQVVQAWAGRPVSPLTVDEAHRLGNMLNALPSEQKATAVAALSKSVGPSFSLAIASQINEKDRALSLAMAAGTSMTTGASGWFGDQTIAPRPVSTLIIKGQQALKDKTGKDESNIPDKIRAKAAESLGDALSGRAREDVLDAASFIYLGMQAEGQSASYDRAVSLAVGGPLIEHNGRKLPAYPGMTTDMMRDKLRAMKPPALAQQLPDGKVYAGSKAVDTTEFLTGLPDSTLEPAGLGRYFVRSGAGLATNSQGKPITIEVR